jgi:hypothetical protein
MVQIDKKLMRDVGQGVSDGMGTAWKGAKKQAGRIEFRTPFTYSKPSAAKPWLLGLAIFSAVAAIAAGVFYFRKRKQVSDRYNMGEADSGETLDSISREELMAANH